jgi:cell division protein ZapA
VKPETEISIFGQSYVVKGDDPEYIREVARYVDHKMRELLGEPGSGLTTRGAVLAAINIADEFFKHRKESQAFREEVEDRSRKMMEML